MNQWDDLRFVLAVARWGGLGPAARALGVNHSTVFRRIKELERRAGTLLFDRRNGAYQPTEAGLAVVDAAERVETEIFAAERALTGRDRALEGRLRVTCSETLAFRALPQEIMEFRNRHQGIRVELLIDNRQLDLSRREADAALRATRPSQPDLFGRKLIDMVWAPYVARSRVGRGKLPDSVSSLAGLEVIGWGETALPVLAADWVSANVPEECIVYRSSSLLNQMMAVKAGVGVAVLPCYLAEPEPDLVRLMLPVGELTRELWLITHEDLRRTARIQAFMEVVGEGVRRRVAELQRGVVLTA